MGDIVDLQGKPVPTRDDIEFIADMARFGELILTEKAIRKKYRLADDVWNALGNDDNLVRAIKAESVRRIRDGSCKREKSQALVVKAPDVAASIMLNDSANDRHRLDACKVLNDFAANGPPERRQRTIPDHDQFWRRYRTRRSLDRSQSERPRSLDDGTQVPFPVIAAKRDEQW